MKKGKKIVIICAALAVLVIGAAAILGDEDESGINAGALQEADSQGGSYVDTEVSGSIDENPDKRVSIKRLARSFKKYDRYGNLLGNEFFLYRSMLSDEEQAAYDYIYNQAITGNGSFSMGVSVDYSSMDNIWRALYNENPELFWLNSGVSYSYNNYGEVTKITLQQLDLVNDLDTAKYRFESAAETILSQAETIASTAGKVKYVHDTLTNWVDYVSGSAYNQSAYSALVNGQSVCSGYSRAFQYIMQQLGIPCYTVIGDAGGSHSWSLVYVDGTYYDVDVTWDDPIGNPPDTYYTTYLLVSDSQLSSKTAHVRSWMSSDLPDADRNYSGEFSTALGETSPVYNAVNTRDDNEDIINYQPDIQDVPEGGDGTQGGDSEIDVSDEDYGDDGYYDYDGYTYAGGAFDYVWKYNEWQYDEDYAMYYMEFNNGVVFIYDTDFQWYYICDENGDYWEYDDYSEDFILLD